MCLSADRFFRPGQHSPAPADGSSLEAPTHAVMLVLVTAAFASERFAPGEGADAATYPFKAVASRGNAAGLFG